MDDDECRLLAAEVVYLRVIYEELIDRHNDLVELHDECRQVVHEAKVAIYCDKRAGDVPELVAAVNDVSPEALEPQEYA
jgi:hypothetical protein